MDWWRILSSAILEISVMLFFVFYVLRQSGLTLSIWNNQQELHPKILPDTQSRGGCLRVLDLPLAPGIAFTVFLIYVAVAMFLLTPIHPTPDDHFWQFVTSALILTLLMYPPIFMLAVIRIATISYEHPFNLLVYIKIFVSSLLLLIGFEVIVWVGIYT